MAFNGQDPAEMEEVKDTSHMPRRKPSSEVQRNKTNTDTPGS